MEKSIFSKKEQEQDQDEKALKEIIIINKNKEIEANIENLELEEGMDVVLEKWTLRKIIKAIDSGKIIVDHDFQRDEVYRTLQKSSIIDSLMKGKCIPPLYAFEDRSSGDGTFKLSIIDGQQRLSAIRDFMKNRYALRIPYGKFSVLNNYTYEQIERINKTLAYDIADLVLDINVIRNIDKEEAQEYFGLINTTSTPLSPGEKLWSLHDPVKSILMEIVNNPYFKITNLRRTRKREYLIATKLLWNQMFLNPLLHDFVGDTVQEFMNYFNTSNDVELMESSKNKVLSLLQIYSRVVNDCQYSPRSQGDLYSVMCFLSVLDKKNMIDEEKLAKFIDWVFKGVNKQIYPVSFKNEFEKLLGNRVSSRGHTNPRDFVMVLESLYKDGEQVWGI